jgi:hypothetical protein
MPGIDIGASIQQGRDRFGVACPRGVVQRGTSQTVATVHGHPGGKQRFDPGNVARLSGLVEFIAVRCAQKSTT